MRSRRRLALRLLAAISAVIALMHLYPVRRENFSQENVDLQWWEDFKTINVKSKQRRKNILIISHGRSGSTITGDIFNHHPSVFYLHEPLQTVQRIYQKMDTHTDERYASLMVEFLSNVLRCNFTKSVVKDFDKFYREPSHPQVSHAIASPPLCPFERTDPRWDTKLCPPMTSESLGNTCRNKYPLTVAKLLMFRIAGNNIKNILTACNSSYVECKIIFLVRDPRAVIPSSRSVGFFSDHETDISKNSIRLYSYQKCKQTEESLVFLKNLPLSWRSYIMIQRYEDLAMNPLDVLPRLYNFAGLPVLDSVKIWLNKTTHPVQDREDMTIEGHPAFLTVDDASAAANRWRWKVHPYDIDIIEHYCKHVMQIMGYLPVDRSYELMSDLSVPMFTDDYEAKGWFPN